jgi:hypothetical protein
MDWIYYGATVRADSWEMDLALIFPRFPGHPERLQGNLKQGVTHG